MSQLFFISIIKLIWFIIILYDYIDSIWDNNVCINLKSILLLDSLVLCPLPFFSGNYKYFYLLSTISIGNKWEHPYMILWNLWTPNAIGNSFNAYGLSIYQCLVTYFDHPAYRIVFLKYVNRHRSEYEWKKVHKYFFRYWQMKPNIFFGGTILLSQRCSKFEAF